MCRGGRGDASVAHVRQRGRLVPNVVGIAEQVVDLKGRSLVINDKRKMA